MSTFSQAGTFLVQSLGSFYLAVVMLRFLLQVSRADFYNPISQFLIKATHLPSKPLRKVFPTYRNFDLASLVLALLSQTLAIELSALINGFDLVNPLYAIAWGAVGILSLVLNVYLYGLLIVIIVSWVAPRSQHPALILLNQLIRPLMIPFQRIIPPMGGLDLSPIFIFLVINMLQIFLNGIARSLMLPPGLVPGI